MISVAYLYNEVWWSNLVLKLAPVVVVAKYTISYIVHTYFFKLLGHGFSHHHGSDITRLETVLSIHI